MKSLAQGPSSDILPATGFYVLGQQVDALLQTQNSNLKVVGAHKESSSSHKLPSVVKMVASYKPTPFIKPNDF